MLLQQRLEMKLGEKKSFSYICRFFHRAKESASISVGSMNLLIEIGTFRVTLLGAPPQVKLRDCELQVAALN